MTTTVQENIELVDIEKELKRLWDEEQGKKRTRACFFNLVIYLQKNSHTETYATLIHQVISKFPCRVLLILSDLTPGQERLRTQVSTEALAEGVFCEIIQIDVAGKLHERLPYLLFPLILPDLPLYLLWTQDATTETTLLPLLEPYAKRIIFDPQENQDLQKSCQNTLKLLDTCQKAVGDLHWSAGRGWRKIFASLFDTEENIKPLELSNLIRITYNKTSIRQAAYMQGWLASRLGWKFKQIEKNKGDVTLTYITPYQEVQVILHCYDDPLAPSPMPSGTILEIAIDSNDHNAHMTFKRHPEARQVFFQYSDQKKCHLPKYLFLSGVTEGQEIIDEIFYPMESPHYRKTIGMVSEVPWDAL